MLRSIRAMIVGSISLVVAVGCSDSDDSAGAAGSNAAGMAGSAGMAGAGGAGEGGMAGAGGAGEGGMAGAGGAGEGGMAGAGGASGDFKSATAGGVTTKWKFNASSVSFVVSAPTTGWVSVGWGATSKMAGADIKIGYVDGTNVMIRDDVGTSGGTHASDESKGGTSDISEIKGSEDNGVTTIEFEVPLSGSDANDKPLVQGQEIEFIMAHGANGADNYTSMHAGVGVAKVTL